MKFVRRNLLLFFCFLFISTIALYPSVELKIEKVGKPQNTKGGEEVYTAYLKEPFKIKVIVSDEMDINQKPKLKGIDQFRIYNLGSTRYTTLINNSFSSSTIYSYDIVAEKDGDYEIGPAEVNSKGKIISSGNKIKIGVKERPGGIVSVQDEGERESGGDLQDKIFCELSSDKSRVVLGEPLLISARFFYTNLATKVGEIEMPSMSDFLVKDVSRSTNTKRVVKNNVSFYTIEQNFVVIPTTIGRKEISPFRAVYQFPVNVTNRGFGFFHDPFSILGLRYKNKVITSNKLFIQVDDLPSYNRRVDAVGEFNDMDLFLGGGEALVNEPVTLTLNLRGKGNFDQIEIPKLVLPQHFKYYESKVEFKDDSSFGKISGTKQFEYILQVGKEGKWKLPPLEFTYFDLASRGYKTFKSKPLFLEIKAPKGISGQKPQIDYKKEEKKTEEAYEKDINFIEENSGGGSVSEGFQSRRYIPWWLFLIFLFLPILFIFKVSLPLLMRKIGGRFRSQNDFLTVKRKLHVMKKNNDIKNLYSLFLDFFAGKFNISRNEVTEDLVHVKLKNCDWPDLEIDKFLEYLNICASQTFSSSQSTTLDESFIWADAENWFLKLNKKRFGNED